MPSSATTDGSKIMCGERVRLVLARQTDAEMVMVLSKTDTVDSHATGKVAADFHLLLRPFAAAVTGDAKGAAADALQKILKELLSRELLRVSVATKAAVEDTRAQFERSVMQQAARAFAMPATYTRVLRLTQDVSAATAGTKVNEADRVKSLLVPVGDLISRLVDEMDGLNTHDCRDILATLHDLGDILWFEQEYHTMNAGSVVIFDPRLVLDIVREVINHELEGPVYDALRTRGVFTYSLLMTLPLWGALGQQGHELVRFFKRLLRQFNLAYPLGNADMEWDSERSPSMHCTCSRRASSEQASHISMQ